VTDSPDSLYNKKCDQLLAESIRKQYDESLGPINYLAARRDKAVLVSFPFPITQVLLLISAEPTANIENLAKKVVEIFTDVK